MNFPYIVVNNLSEELKNKWDNCYENYQDKYKFRNRKLDEGIWRRNQMFGTRHESGWRSRDDMRRRMLHYSHYYDVKKYNGMYDLCMIESYLWIHLTFPKREIEVYYNDILKGLQEGGWENIIEEASYKEYKKGNLFYRIWHKQVEQEDSNEGRKFPDFYRILEIQVCTENKKENFSEKRKTWGVLNNGPRIKDVDGDYEAIKDLNEIKKYLPAHVELGCGPSIELGIPPLNFLHDVYYVTDKSDNTFILSPEKDKLAYEVAAHTEERYKLFSTMYKQCFLAKAESEFYVSMKKLMDNKVLLNPIFTNNFDGIPIQLGMDEYFLRRYEMENLLPNVQFNENAKSLISVGCHADRRKIQAAARKAGLKVIHIDPEGYFDKNGGFVPYALEAKKDGDILYRKDASVAFAELLEIIEGE